MLCFGAAFGRRFFSYNQAMQTQSDKAYFQVLDTTGALQNVQIGDRMTAIAGVPYTHLWVMELEPLAHDPLIIPTLYHAREIEITPLQRSNARQDLQWDEDFNAPVAESGALTTIKQGAPFVFEGQVHWSRAGRVMMGPGGDNKDSLGWITVENPNEALGFELFRIHFHNRARS